ncbi:MAG: hypothetical protein GX219_09605 [Tissierellia bacterium]|nr:hypothetical protein [Tissierellia bacterium]
MKKFIIILLCIMLVGCNFSSSFSNINNNIEEISIPILNFDTLNPYLTKSRDNYNFLKNVYDSLFIINEDGEPIPSIADVKYSNDKLSIDFYLLDEKKFNNGSIMTSEDIKFTIDAIKYAIINNNSDFLTSYIYSISNIKDIEIISDQEFKISFISNSPLNPYSLTFPILSKNSFKDVDEVFKFDNYIPNGSGDYSLLNINNEEYEFTLIKEKKGKPKKIIGKFYKNYIDILHDFESELVNFTIANKFFVDKMKNNGNIKRVEYTTNEYEYILFLDESDIFKGENGLFFRNMLDNLIDKDFIVNRIYSGMGEVCSLPFYHELTSNQENKQSDNGELKKIKEDLNFLGYQDVDEDGFLEDLEGRRLSIKIAIDKNPYREAVAEYIKKSLSSLGIDSEIDYHDVDLSKVNSLNDFNLLNEKAFDILLTSSTIEASPYIPDFLERELISVSRSSYEKYTQIISGYDNGLILENSNNIYKFIEGEKVIIGLFFHKSYLLSNNDSINVFSPISYNPYNMAK